MRARRLLPRTGAGAPVRLDMGVVTLRDFTRDGGVVVYSKRLRESDRRWGDYHVVRAAAGARPCTITGRTDARVVGSSHSGRILLAEQDPEDGTGTTVLNFNDATTCRNRGALASVNTWHRLADDRADRWVMTAESLPLRAHGTALLTALAETSAGLVIKQEAVSASTFGTVTAGPGADEQHVLYTVDGGWSSDGLYLRTVTFPR